MATREEWQRINLRKVSMMLIDQIARTSYPELPLAQGRMKVIAQYPRLGELYDEGHRRGDAADELMPPAPVTKASGRTKAQVLADIEARATALVAKRGAGITMAQAKVEVVTKEPRLYTEYNEARHDP